MGNTITSPERREEDRLFCYTVEHFLRYDDRSVYHMANWRDSQGRRFRGRFVGEPIPWTVYLIQRFVLGEEDIPMDSLVRTDLTGNPGSYEYVRFNRNTGTWTQMFNQDDFPRFARLPEYLRAHVAAVLIQEARNIVCRALMMKLRFRVIASAYVFNHGEPGGLFDVQPGLLSLNSMERYPYVLDIDPARQQEDRRYFQTFWEGTFVRRSFPWPEGETAPADYGRWCPAENIPQIRKDTSLLRLEIDGNGVEVLAAGEPEYNYFPRNHPMRKALQRIQSTANLNMQMITEERYWQRRFGVPHTMGDLPQQVYDIVNTTFAAATMFADFETFTPIFQPEDVTSGRLHALYINMRNHAIYVRTKLFDMIALYEDRSLMRKFSGLQRSDMAIRTDFDEDGHYSMMGYHGIVTTNPEYNYTHNDLHRLGMMLRLDASQTYDQSLSGMGYKYNGVFAHEFTRRLNQFFRMAQRQVEAAIDPEERRDINVDPGSSPFEVFRLNRDRHRMYHARWRYHLDPDDEDDRELRRNALNFLLPEQ